MVHDQEERNRDREHQKTLREQQQEHEEKLREQQQTHLEKLRQQQQTHDEDIAKRQRDITKETGRYTLFLALAVGLQSVSTFFNFTGRSSTIAGAFSVIVVASILLKLLWPVLSDYRPVSWIDSRIS